MLNRSFINGVELLSEGSAPYLDIDDRGLHYGDGFFETLRVCRGRIPLWDYHRQRMEAAAQRLHFDLDDFFCQWQGFFDALRFPLAHHEALTLKLIITRGAGPRGYKIPSSPNLTWCLRLYDYQPPKQSAYRLRLCDHRLSRQPTLAGLKHLNRLDQVLARSEWQQQYDEGLMANIDGHWVEGTMSNLYWVKQGIVYTPDLSQEGVNGVVRRWLLEHHLLQIASCTLDELMAADEVFVSNSLIGIMPVACIERQDYTIGPISTSLNDALLTVFDDRR